MTTIGYLAAEPDEDDPRKPWDPPWRRRTAHRSCDPEAAAVLRNARRTRGWSVSEAARRSGVSRRMIGMLEAAQRRLQLDGRGPYNRLPAHRE